MIPGQVVAGRFEIEHLAGSGGMGVVYRALDRATGKLVALKVLRGGDGQEPERFQRESRVLLGLEHPGIVRYVMHGATEAGDLYLAMDWLSGEDLQVRLARNPVSVKEALSILSHVAGALAVAHAHDVVHRDIKPSNIFLEGGDVDKIKLLDFGIARVNHETQTATSAETTLGTPEYMSPEQARGARTLDARSDIFSLGCVAFECLTGKPVFSGSDLMALLARVLLEDAPRVREFCPEVPAPLDELVARMLARDPAKRPMNGSALAKELGSLDALSPSHSVAPASRKLTRSERKLLSVIVTKGPAESKAESAVADTVAAGARGPTFDALRSAVQAHGGSVERLADGSLIATLCMSGAATDQARTAARCALTMQGIAKDAAVVLATGPGDLSARGPGGEVLERAVRMLRDALKDPLPGPVRNVRIDDMTAGLLDARFELGVRGAPRGLPGSEADDERGLELVAEREMVDTTRTLLGREGPCVGRERELDMLEGLFDECLEEPMAHAVLITGAAGVGKSRVRYEFLKRLARREVDHEVWMARGDPMGAASPFGLLGHALRHALGIVQVEPLAVRQRRLKSRIARHVDPADVDRVTEFLGELTGVHFPAEGSVQLRAARQDAMLMGDQMRRAWEDLVAAECKSHPLVIVLDDLQWGDLPTVSFLDAALRMADRPLMVLAAARPEVHECFPRIWAGRPVTHIQLDKLTRKASEKLVREFFGDDLGQGELQRMVERAAGNAFYLEEIIRSVAEGRGNDLPETVIAMVQARLEAEGDESRRILRAASLFGQSFWRGGVLALLGDDERSTHVAERLEELVEKELIVRQGKGRFPGEAEFSFRHAILREAAYGMLTSEDRELGHRLAAAWLEKAGERDAMVLAEHLERGRESRRAVSFYLRAAEQALEGNDLELAISRAERGIRGGAEGSVLGALLLVQIEAYRWRGEAEAEAAERCAVRAKEAFPERSAAWFTAAGEAAAGACRRGDPALARAFIRELDPSADPVSRRAQTIAAALVSVSLLNAGGFTEATALLSEIDRVGGDLLPDDPFLDGWVERARALRAAIDGDAAAFLCITELAATRFEAAGYIRNACLQQTNAGFARCELGSFDEAERTLRAALASAEQCGLPSVAAATRHTLGLALLRLGRLDEAEMVETLATTAFEAQSNARMEGGCRVYLSWILRLAGRLDEALAEARHAVRLLERAPPALTSALGMVAEVQLAQGRTRDALFTAEQAMKLLETLGGIEEGETRVRLVHALCLFETGATEAAKRAVQKAKDQLEERAAKIADPIHRVTFLGTVPENARVLALADVTRGGDTWGR
jgi:eukaryotic-like serine/threonine-protein kinase